MIKIGSFFEEHIEKIILGIVGFVCVWLLIMRVLLSPNVVEYDNDRHSPGAIDKYISKQAKELKERLNRMPEPAAAYKSPVPDFIARFNSPIKEIDISIVPPQPYVSDKGPKRSYRLPEVGAIDDPAIEHIRAVVYIPVEVAGQLGARVQNQFEPSDIDLVTVQSSIDAAGLYMRFHESFAGDDLKERWRDPCLARPIFAAVQLQRQELLDDGSWSDWRDVPRTKIEPQAELFEIIEKVAELPAGGLAVRMLRFGERRVQTDLLQPEAYQIASANEEWFPPVLHEKFLEIQEARAKQEKREALEAEKEEREKEREYRRGGSGNRYGDTRTRTRGSISGTSSLYGGIESLYGSSGTRSRRSRGSDRTTGRYSEGGSTRRRRGETDDDLGREREFLTRREELAKKGPTIDDVYDELDSILITPLTDLSRLSSLVFWAHDDTVEPEKSYRYRMRLGAFNPIAGTDQFDERYAFRENDVILWSDFSRMTDVVSIPDRMYFFAKSINQAAKKVTVQVSKLVLGSWYSEDFFVRQGEVIGGIVESEKKRPLSVGIGGLRSSYYRSAEDIREPDAVDYDTGAVMVDVVAVNDWQVGSKMRPRHYFDMLYSFDDSTIEHMPVKNAYWASNLQVMYNEIRKMQSEPKEPFRPFNSGAGMRSRLRQSTTGRYDLYDEEYDLYDEDRAMEEMMDRRRR